LGVTIEVLEFVHTSQLRSCILLNARSLLEAVRDDMSIPAIDFGLPFFLAGESGTDCQKPTI
jgi:hypothetical protein